MWCTRLHAALWNPKGECIMIQGAGIESAANNQEIPDLAGHFIKQKCCVVPCFK